MVESGPYPGDGVSRPPRKPRHEQRSSRTGTQDRNSEFEDGYGNERTGNQDERHQKRQRDRHQDREDRGQRRSREDASRAQYKNTEPEREERDQSRQHRDRGRDGHRDHSEEDRGHSRSHQHYKDREGYRSQKSHSQGKDEYRSEKSHSQGKDDYRSEKSYSQGRDDHRSESYNQGKDDYRSEKSYSQGRDDYRSEKSYDQGKDDYQKERNRIRFDDQERYVRGSDLRGYPDDNRSGRSFPPDDPQITYIEDYEETEGGILDCHKCRYLCTGRACCQLVEVLLNMLILICCSISYNSTGGYTGITNLGGIYYYQFGGAYSGFSGEDGVKAQALDVEFYNLKLPTVTASMAYGGALMAFSCLLILLGVLRVPWRWPVWLLVEFALDIAIAVGYIPALYFYFQRLQDAYNSPVCKDREALYSSKGYQGFTCALHGADIAAALFACMAIIAFLMSALLAIKGFRTVRRKKKKPANEIEF